MAESLPLKQTTTYTFKYETDSDSIDLSTLLSSQVHLGTILNEIKQQVAADANLQIKIRPLTKGSVPFDIVLNLSWLQSLFSGENLMHAATIVATLVNLIQLRIWLKGRKPESTQEQINNTVIIVIDGQKREVTKEVYDLHANNAVMDAAFRKSFEAIEEDEDVTGIQILDEKKQPLISVPRQQFEDIAAPQEGLGVLTQKDISSTATLTIFKVVFGKGYKWQFYYMGRKISATIADDDFMERVNNGERFAKGDTLIVEMEIEKVYDKTMDIFIEKNFRITKVFAHRKPAHGRFKLF